MTAAAVFAFDLRCFSCSHRIGVARQAMRLAAAFKPSLVPAVAMLEDEQRHRCRSCGWVNVFVPATRTASWREIQLKGAIDGRQVAP